MGLEHQARRMEVVMVQEEKKAAARKIDLDDFSLKIAIVRSN